MLYKKIIPNQETRFNILKKLRFIPDKYMIAIQYFVKLKRLPNISKPKTFTEKLQWYKLYYRDPKMTQCADKYNVRKYVEEKGLKDILIPVYGIYDKPEDINFEELPNKFVMKTTNGSGTNLICTDKNQLDLKEVKEQFDIWLERDIFASGREWSYKNIKPRIIIEEFVDSDNDQYSGLTDYKFFCFNGKAEYIFVYVDRDIDTKRAIYDMDWNKIDVTTKDFSKMDDKIEKPTGLEEMIEIANYLSQDFPFVRVDLYWENNEIYFGEMTFYPATGYFNFIPKSFDYELGNLFKLEKMIF